MVANWHPAQVSLLAHPISQPHDDYEPYRDRGASGLFFVGFNAIRSELDAKLDALTEAESRRTYEEWMREQAAKIEVAYLAGYSGRSHKGNVVWALQFKDPEEAKSYFEPVRIANQSAEYNYYFIKRLDHHLCMDR